MVRFSNAAGTGQPDTKPDLRGVALRVHVSPEESHDLLMTNFPVSHARNARQFVEFAKATAGGRLSQLLGILRLIRLFGLRETMRMLRNVLTARGRTVSSVATETYWSRGAHRWGPTLAVRYLLRPAPDTVPAPRPPTDDPDYLSTEAARRLARGDVRFELCIQRYVDEKSTPIEDTAVEWKERVSPAEPVAVLTIARGDLSTADALAQAQIIDGDGVQPVEHHRRVPAARQPEPGPQGGLRRRLGAPARLPLAEPAAAAQRGDRRRGPRKIFGVVNRYVPWHRLPVRLGLLNLEVFRYVLRARNLLDSELREAPPAARPVPPAPPGEHARVTRTFDGTSNDLSAPAMGAVGSAFGRNLRRTSGPSCSTSPTRSLVSQQLLYREQFLPAPSLNLLAAAWIQFQVHDWVTHARYPLGQADVRVPLPDGMTWSNTPGGARRSSEMRIAGQHPVPRRPAEPDEPRVREQHHALVGRVRGVRRRRRPRAASSARARSCGSPTDTCPRTPGLRDHRLQRELVAGARRPAHAVRPRAQPALRRAARPLPRLERRARSTRRRG